jgi:hypothetical protein
VDPSAPPPPPSSVRCQLQAYSLTDASGEQIGSWSNVPGHGSFASGTYQPRLNDTTTLQCQKTGQSSYVEFCGVAPCAPGQAKITCESDGLFHPAPQDFTCKNRDETCYTQTDLHGTWTPAPAGGFTIGTRTSLSCSSPYIKSGAPFTSDRLICYVTGWSLPPEHCYLPVACPSIYDPHGTWSAPPSGSLYTPGTTATLRCTAGYHPISTVGEESTVTCGTDGQWMSLQSVCGANTPPPPQTSVCAPPRAGTGGHWTPVPAHGFQVGSRATLTCDAGYQSEGAAAGGGSSVTLASSLTCICPDNGSPCDWDSRQDRCINAPGINTPGPRVPDASVTTCTTPSNSHGRWSPDARGDPSPPGGYAPGAMARLECNPGYFVSGTFGHTALLVCGSNSSWNRPPYDCLPPPTSGSSTCVLPTDPNGQWSAAPSGGFVTHSSTHLTCNPGYTAQLTAGQEQTLTCGTETAGQWAGTPDVCLQSTTPVPQPLPEPDPEPEPKPDFGTMLTIVSIVVMMLALAPVRMVMPNFKQALTNLPVVKSIEEEVYAVGTLELGIFVAAVRHLSNLCQFDNMYIDSLSHLFKTAPKIVCNRYSISSLTWRFCTQP